MAIVRYQGAACLALLALAACAREGEDKMGLGAGGARAQRPARSRGRRPAQRYLYRAG